MPFVPSQLQDLADCINDNGEQRATVRTLLSWFGAQRRGALIVGEIREALRQVQVVTHPAFENAYIDDFVVFVREELPHEPVEGCEPTPERDPFLSISVEDIVPRVGVLPAANRLPTSVGRDDTVEKAITLMLLHDYSQLPVMQGNRDVQGFISWQTIGQARMRDGHDPHCVRECMSTAVAVLSWNETLFSATQHIIDKGFVLIKGRDQSVTGLLTTSDVGQQFKDLSEAFLLIGEIENNLRRLLSGKFRISELRSCISPNETGRDINNLSDLTFGEYIRLIESRERWEQMSLSLDRGTFVVRMNEVRLVRNGVMHFQPDGISEDDVQILADTLRFLQGLQ
jgi:CBS domain-containing protein